VPARSMPNLFTRDIEAAVEFYRDRLGLAQDYQVPAEGRPIHVVLRLGDSLLALTAAEAASPGMDPSPGRPFELIVWCTDVDRETERLRNAGAEVVAEPYEHLAGHRRSYLADPDGNRVALVDAH
jgi:catechol 2,3-dioxygenase-like lactoylglutathione lyase family enzyme